MILLFIFNYPINNAVLENFLNDIAKDFSFNYKIKREKENIEFYIESEEEGLIEFSNKMSSLLPSSIFLKDISVKVVKQMPDFKMKLPFGKINFSLTPMMIKKAFEINNPFINSDLSIIEGENIIIKNNKNNLDFTSQDSTSHIIKEMAKAIKNSVRIKIYTQDDCFVLGSVSPKSFEDLRNIEFVVMPTNLSNIQEMLVINKDELIALGTVERPSMALKVNLVFAQKKYLPISYVEIKMPNNLFLYFLGNELFKLGIKFFYLAKDNNSTLDTEIIVKHIFKKDEDCRISILEDKTILLVYGKRFMERKYKNIFEKIKEPKHCHYIALLEERGLFDKSSCGLYLSTIFDDGFMLYENDDLLEVLNFSLPEKIGDILSSIEKSSNNGKKLIRNYKTQFPEIFEDKILNLKIHNHPKNFYIIFGIIGVILGFEKDILSSAKQIMEKSEDFAGKKGPRIDFIFNEDLREINVLKLIQSSISFKLAGVDDLTLSFGLVESLAYFLSDFIDIQKTKVKIDCVGLCGSMFGYKKLVNLTKRNIIPSCEVYFNIQVPLDSEKKEFNLYN